MSGVKTWRQFHLATWIALTIVAAILLGLNLTGVRRNYPMLEYGKKIYVEYGWPWHAMYIEESFQFDRDLNGTLDIDRHVDDVNSEVLKELPQFLRRKEGIGDIAVAIVILVVTAVISEFIIRRRNRRPRTLAKDLETV